MKSIVFERTSGIGSDALYSLYVDGVKVGERLHMSEINKRLRALETAAEKEKQND